MGTGDSGNYYTSGGSESVHHQALIHSIDGEYTHDPKTGRPQRLKAGGHGQANIEVMEKNGIEYNVVKTYENGVRVGNVPNHKHKRKQAGTTQAWFPRVVDSAGYRESGRARRVAQVESGHPRRHRYVGDIQRRPRGRN